MDNFVTQEQCDERRSDLYQKVSINTNDINDLKVSTAKTQVSLDSIVSLAKATFTAVVSGMVTIIIILLTRGI